MDKDLEELSQILASEIKRELIENYLFEKFYLEEEWKDYNELLENLKEKQKKIFDNAWKLYFLLKDEILIKKFESFTRFPLKNICEESIFKEFYNISQEKLEKKLFEDLKAPFAFTSKGKFVNLFLYIYKCLSKAIEEYLKEYEKMKKLYERLKEDTETFSKNFNLSYILGFFAKLEAEQPEIGKIKNKTKIREELNEKLKIPIPEPLEHKFTKIKPLPEFSKIKNELVSLAKSAFEKNPQKAKEILNYLQ